MMLVNAICLAYAIYFIHVICSWDGHIFSRLDRWMEEAEAPEWLTKPFYDCPICMSIWWGMIFQAALHYDFHVERFSGYVPEMLFTCMIAGGINVLNVIASKAYEKMTD